MHTESPTASTSTLPPVEHHDTDKISAYYSLAFPNFTYYLQTLTVTIGRRPIPSATTPASDVLLVDVDLGPLKSVSRLHARIEYEEEEERFVLVVLGRNGAWVDGIWAGCGSKVPLGARSQIQIATRTFHFILPPPQDFKATSLSPPPSTARQRSPSLDITSLSPVSSRLASPTAHPATVPDAPGSTSKHAKPTKKRKRPEPGQTPPEKMPPKPQATYAVMCYRAITSLGGKASLQDVIQWMIDNYEWYRLNVGGPWENSIRHNLSSNRAFRNVARSGDERGKGFMWGIDPKAERGLQDQDAKARQAELERQQGHIGAAAAPRPSAPKVQLPVKPVFTTEPLNKSVPVKDKNPTDHKPALSKMPKAPLVNGIAPTSHTILSAHTEPAPPPATTSISTTASSPSLDTPAPVPVPSSSGMPQIPTNVSLPIIVAPLPDSHPAASASAAALASPASALFTTPPIVLHAGTLILNPAIFSHLTAEQLKELEGLGAQKALEILQGHIVRFLKEKMRAEGGGRGKGRGRGRGGRVVNKGSRKEGTSAPVDTKPKEEGQDDVSDRPSLQPSSCDLANEKAQTNGVDSAIEEHVMKKRKTDTDNVDVDVYVDVIGL